MGAGETSTAELCEKSGTGEAKVQGMRMRPWVLAAATTAVVAGCGSGIIVVTPPAAPAEARSLILALIKPRLEVQAIDLSSGVPVLNVASGVKKDEEVRIEAHFFRDPLVDLGLSPGILEGFADQREDTKLLVKGDVAEGLSFSAASDAAPIWAPINRIAEELSGYYVKFSAPPCTKFTEELANLPSGFATAFAVPIDDRSLLVAQHSGEVFRVDTSSVVRVQSPVARLVAGTKIGDNDYWFLTGDNTLMRGGFADATRTALQLEYKASHFGTLLNYWIAAGPGDEVYTLTLDGRVLKYEAGAFRTLHTLPPIDANSERPGGIIWLGPGDIMVAWASWQEVVHIKDEVVIDEDINSTNAFTGIANVPGLGGPVAGNSNGEFFLKTGGAWHMLPGSPTRLWPYSIRGTRDGFYFGEAFGQFGQYVAGFGFCPTLRPSSVDIRYIMPVGEDLYLFGDNPNTPSTPFVRLRARR